MPNHVGPPGGPGGGSARAAFAAAGIFCGLPRAPRGRLDCEHMHAVAVALAAAPGGAAALGGAYWGLMAIYLPRTWWIPAL